MRLCVAIMGRMRALKELGRLPAATSASPMLQAEQKLIERDIP
jgi:hypothetical protein